ncbi:MAG: phospho-sugar mutase [Clostridia bacterium]|nr:phospho-sugar mutase [Clostridia bacterium]
MNDINKLYEQWMNSATADADLIPELESVKGDEEAILDRFYKNLEFGTAGLRGVIGAGTNRMNVYTVNQATQGLADYLNETFPNPSVAIAYDSRIKSKEFAESAAGVLAANGIKVYIYPELVPTPMLSFAVRRLECSSGIIITASHNPSKYNGYKCYDPNGYQMTDEAAAKTYEFIQNIDMFTGVKTMSFEDALAEDMVDFIEDWLYEEFYAKVSSCLVNPDSIKKADLKLIYTPLNGAGNKPVRKVLKMAGIKDVTVVKEQEKPDGNFPTCPYPNPEIRQAFECAIETAKGTDADLLLATDPDCDRVGIAVKDGNDYVLMTGNEVGAMLAEYLLSSLKEQNKLPENPVVVKSIVTTPLIEAICKAYGAEVADLLTGFKYIGELITNLEKEGKEDNFVVGMEESYGYLRGIHARDKDAVVASLMICEMAAVYKLRGISLKQFMDSIYAKYGMYLNTVLNFAFEGASGMQKMADIMNYLRENAPTSFADKKVVKVADYKESISKDMLTGESVIINLPKSNVLSYTLEDNSKVIVRPSGTEPKIKVYITAYGNTRTESEEKTTIISEYAKELLGV